MIKLSIIIPVYNTEKFIKKCINRPETEFEHQARLMSMIMTRWRAPQHKRLFEEQLIYLLQAVGEYNAETKRAPALHTKAVPNL